MADGRIVIDTELDASGAERGLSALQQSIDRIGNDGLANMGRNMQQVGNTVGKVFTGMGLAIGAGLGAGVVSAANFDSSMSKVQALSGATGSDFESLRDIAQEMGAKTQFSAVEAAEGLQYMALAGWDTHQMVSGLPSVLDLAAAGSLDLGRASDIVTDTMSAYGMEATEASRVSDVLAYAQANANTSVEQLGEAFTKASPAAAAAGMDIEQTTAVLGLFADQGLKGSRAGTVFDAILRDIRNSAEDGALQIGETSVAVYDAEGNMRSMADIMRDVEAATSDMTGEQRDQALGSIFQIQALQGVNMMLNEGTDSLFAFEDELRNSDGAARDMAETMMDNLGGELLKLKSALEGLAITVGSILMPAIRLAVTIFTSFIDILNNLPGPVITIITIVAALTAGFFLVVGALGFLTAAIGTVMIGLVAISTGLGITVTAAGGLVVILGAAIGAVIGFIATMVTLAVALSEGWISFGWLTTAIDATMNAFSEMGRIISALSKYFWAIIEDGDFMNDWVTHLPEPWQEAIMAIGERLAYFRELLLNTSEAIGQFIQSAITVIQSMAEGFVTGFQSITEAIGTFLSGGLNLLVTGFNNLIEALGPVGTAIVTVAGFISDVAVGAFSALMTAVDFVVENFRTFLGPLTGVTMALLGITGPVGMAISALIFLATQTTFVSDIIAMFKGEMEFSEVVENVVNMTVAFIENLTQMATSAIEKGTEIMLNLITGFSENLPLWIEAGTTALTAFIENITAQLPMLLETGVQALTSLIEGLVSVIPILIETALTIVTTLIEGLVTALPMLVETGITIIQALVEALIVALPTLLGLGPMIITEIIQAVVEQLPMLIELGLTLITSLLDAIVVALPTLMTAGTEALTTIIQAIVEALPLLIEAALQIITALLDALIVALPQLISVGTEALSTIVQALIEALPLLIDAALQIIMALVDGIIQVLPLLIDAAIQIIMAIVDALVQNLPLLIEAGIQILTALVDAIIEMLPLLIDAAIQIVTALVDALIENLPLLIEAGWQMLEAVAEGANEIGDQLIQLGADAIQWVIDGITGGFGDLWESGAELMSQFGEGISSAADTVTSKAEEIAGGIRDFFPFSPAKTGPLSTIDQMDFGGPIAGSIDSGSGQPESSAIQMANMIQNAVVNGLQTMLSAAQATLSGFAGIVTSGFSGAISAASSAVSNIGSAVSNGFSGVISSVSSAMSSVGSAISTGFSSAVSAVSSAVSSISSSIASGFSSAVSAVSSAMSSVGSAISSGFSSAVSAVSSAISSITSSISSGFSSALSAVTSAMSSVLSAISSTFSNVVSTVSSALSNVVSSVSSGFSNVVSVVISSGSSIVSSIVSTFSSFLSAVQNGMSNAISTVSSMMSQMVSTVTSFVGQMASAGRDVVMGLANGIKNAAGSAVSAAKSMAQGAVKAAKSALKINSPSRVFMEMGNFVGEGLTIGVDAEKGDVLKKAGELSQWMTPSMPDLPSLSAQTHQVVHTRGREDQNNERLMNAINELGDKLNIAVYNNFDGDKVHTSMRRRDNFDQRMNDALGTAY